jgi:hypothetical protein
LFNYFPASVKNISKRKTCHGFISVQLILIKVNNNISVVCSAIIYDRCNEPKLVSHGFSWKKNYLVFLWSCISLLECTMNLACCLPCWIEENTQAVLQLGKRCHLCPFTFKMSILDHEFGFGCHLDPNKFGRRQTL